MLLSVPDRPTYFDFLGHRHIELAAGQVWRVLLSVCFFLSPLPCFLSRLTFYNSSIVFVRKPQINEAT